MHYQRYNTCDGFEAFSRVHLSIACERIREAFGRRYGLTRCFIDSHLHGDELDVWMYERGPAVALSVTYQDRFVTDAVHASGFCEPIRYHVGLLVDSHTVTWEEELRIRAALAVAFECRLIPWERERRIGCDRERPDTVADPGWLSSTVLALARVIDTDRSPEHLPILADALEDAGCTSADVLSHCRGTGRHTHPCWVVDLVLGR